MNTFYSFGQIFLIGFLIYLCTWVHYGWAQQLRHLETVGVTTIIVVYRHAGTRLPGASADWAWPVIFDYMGLYLQFKNVCMELVKVVLAKTSEWLPFSRDRSVQIACYGVCRPYSFGSSLKQGHYCRGSNTSSGSGGKG